MIAPIAAVSSVAAIGPIHAGTPSLVRFARTAMPLLLDLDILKSCVFTNAQKAALTIACSGGRLARRAPAVDPNRPITIDAAALWTMLAYHFSPNPEHRAIPPAQRMEAIFREVYGPDLKAEHYTRIVMVEDAVRSLAELQPKIKMYAPLPRVGDRKPW